MATNRITAIIIIIILLGAAMFVYQGARENEFITKKQECEELGADLFGADSKNRAAGADMFTPQYTYNREMDACLYYGGFASAEVFSEWVKNSYTRQVIISYTTIDGDVVAGPTCPVCLISKDVFDAQKRMMFIEEARFVF